jgi:serine phosphatase RsbU (regulator of sigma subunit)
MIRNIDDVKVKEIEMADGDILLTYSDGIVESKGIS